MGRDRQFRAPFMDLARAEVLRGPQGILFGKNTIAGALNLTTQRATAGADATGSLSVDWEPEYNQQSFVGVFDTGLTDEIGVRVAYKASQGDGFMYNQHLGKDEPATDEDVIRVSFNWQPMTDLEANLKYEHSEFEVDGSTSQIIKLQPLGALANFVVNNVIPSYDDAFETELDLTRSAGEETILENRDTSTDNIALNVDKTFDRGVLSFVTGYSAYETMETIDADISPVPFLGLTDTHEFDQFSQEIRFNTTGDRDFHYIGGVFYQKSDLNIDYWASANATPLTPVLANALRSLPARMLNPAAPEGMTLWDAGIRPEGVNRTVAFRQDTDTQSAFFQGTWHINEQTRLIPGGRYTKEKKEAQRSSMLAEYGSTYYDNAAPASLNARVTAQLINISVPVPVYAGDRDESTFTPSLKLQYDLNSDLMFYASAERGYKAGGINSAADAAVNNQEFDKEQATGFEAGMKSDLLNGEARLNVSVFHTTFEDLQVTSWNGFGFDVGNAAESVSKGLELDGQLWLSNEWSMTASMAYLDSHYTDYKTGPCTALEIATKGAGISCDLTGQTTPYAPEFSGTVFLDHITEVFRDVELRTSLNLNYSDSYFLDADLDKELAQKAYATLGLRVSLAAIDDTWEFGLVGKNLTDKRILSAGQDMPLIAGGYAAFIAEPRTITLQGMYRF